MLTFLVKIARNYNNEIIVHEENTADMKVVFLLKLIHIILSKYLNLLYIELYVIKQILLISVFMRKLMQKLGLLLCIHPQFRAKFYFISNECAISCKLGFVLIRKWCEISCKKIISCKNAKLLRKIIYCFVETLVFDRRYLS